MDDDQELRDGLTERKLHVERILRRNSYDWIQRDQDGVGIPCYRPRLRKTEITQVGLMSHGACDTFLFVVFLVFLVPLASFVFFVATESVDSTDFQRI